MAPAPATHPAAPSSDGTPPTSARNLRSPSGVSRFRVPPYSSRWPGRASVRECHCTSYAFLLDEFLQLSAQSFVGAEQQRLGGRLTQLQHVRDLAVIHLLKLEHDHRPALPPGHALHALAYCHQTFAANNQLFRRERAICNINGRARIVVRF